MAVRDLRTHCALGPDSMRLLHDAMGRLQLTARGHDRVLSVARTIADLEGAPEIKAEHLAEALVYRLAPVSLGAR